MELNKKKGSTIVSAVVLMSIVISFSTLLLALILNSNLFEKYQDIKNQQNITMSKIYQDFIQDQAIDGEYDYLIDVIENEDNINQKAVIAYRNNYKSLDNMCYYCIYDFLEQKILAQQRSNFYVKNINGEYFLAGIIKIFN